MNINNPPISEIAATTVLRKHKHAYNLRVVAALAECIHILPTGACVDLSDGEKALVLVENAADFTRPMILKFNNNMIYDLSDPVIGDSLKVVDIMKTMDSFRAKKLAIAQRKQKTAQKKAMDNLLEGASVLSETKTAPDAAQTDELSAVKKAPRKRMKLV